MKSLRKILAVLLATAMVAGMGAIAFAGVGSITITSNKAGSGNVGGKPFTAYRILDATYAGSGSGVTTIAYSIPSWAVPFYEHYFPNYSGSQAEQDGESFDKYVVDQIAAFKADQVQAFIKDFTDNYKNLAPATYVANVTADPDAESVTFRDLVSGYYIIVDNSTKKPVSALMLDTVLDQDVEIVLKANNESPDKKILGPSGPTPVYSGTTLIGYLNEANQLSAGSTANFVVDEHVPNYNGYEHFYFILNDTLSKGLTYNSESGVQVYIDINDDGDFDDTSVTYTLPNDRPSGSQVLASGTTKGPRSETLEEGKDYYVYVTEDADGNGSTKIQVAFDKIQNFPIGSLIRITYAANLNKDAITGIDTNKNEAHLEFSNRHKSGTSGTPRKDGPSGIPADEIKNILDEGPKDWTDTYSTEVLVKKTDGSGSLAGAQFTLTGNSTQYVVKNQIVYTEDPYGPFWMTKSGTYTTIPPTGDEMKAAPSGAVAGYVEVTDPTDNPASDKEKWVTVNGLTYRPYVPGTDNGRKIYILSFGTNDKYASTVIKYSSGTAQEYSGTAVPVTMVLGGSGSGLNEFLFNQLGAGKYKISETLVPEGYNKAPDIEFEIGWEPVTFTDDNTSGTCRWTISGTQAGKSVTFENLSGTGRFTIDIVNKSGVELPSTGGIGTTIFYAGGALLVLLAGILLVSKRRIA